MTRVPRPPRSRQAPQAPPTADPRVASTLQAYDACAQEYHDLWHQRRPTRAVKTFARLAGAGSVVLDVADGPALDVRGLRDAGLVVVGGDWSPACMQLSRTLHPRGLLARWDFRRLPFADDTFDGVWATAALQHVPRAQVRAVLAEWRRVQRSGPIFVTMREGEGDLVPVEDEPAGTVRVTQVSLEQLRSLLLAGGWQQVEIERRPDPLERSGVTWLHALAQTA